MNAEHMWLAKSGAVCLHTGRPLSHVASGKHHRPDDRKTDDRMQIFYWSNKAQYTRILPSCHGGTSHDDESDNDVDVGVYH